MRISIIKNIAFIITALFIFSSIGYCDTVVTVSNELNGRIKTVSGGMIIIRDGGTDLTYQREVNNEYFGDAVMYKKNFFSRQVQELIGRVESLDRFNAVVYTPVGKIEIQRYKIKNIIMKVPNKGY